jgi:CRISPR-associated endonuclease/helicase Cas3
MNTTESNYSAATSDGLLLPGLDGANPLGFLAALGLLRALDREAARLSWAPSGGTWVPLLATSDHPSLDQDGLIGTLASRLVTSIDDHPAKLLRELEGVVDNEPRRLLLKAISDGNDRQRMDWTSAVVSDFARPESINQLQTTRRDYFYGNLQSVIGRTRPEHLHRAIFHPWDYSDALDNQSLHLDPSEDRRHAHQWNKPAGDPERKVRGGMLGANRLALEAMPLFPSFPEANTLRTVGFTGSRSNNTRWTWPIWSASLSLPVVRSLIAAEILQRETISSGDAALLRARGLVAVYRTHRILVGKTPNFTPAQRIA